MLGSGIHLLVSVGRHRHESILAEQRGARIDGLQHGEFAKRVENSYLETGQALRFGLLVR